MKINNRQNQTQNVSSEKSEMRAYLDSINYRVARSKSELEEAYSLVYSEYLKRGYVSPNNSKLHLSIHNILPDTTTFVALSGDEILATATVIPDSLLGMPMDNLYKDELNALRKKNSKMCEISMLASNTSLFKEGTSMLLNAKKMFLIYYLFKHILDFARDHLKLDYICIAINPKHKMTYENLFFEDLGELKSYDKVNGAPALGKILNLKTAEEKCAKLHRSNIYQLFFSSETDAEGFSGKVEFDLDDIRHFFINKYDILSNVSPEIISYIEKCYPQHDFATIMPHLKEKRSARKFKDYEGR